MNFDIDEDKHTIVIESNDLLCPITCESYTQDNYPITLHCGHTLSIKSFNYLKEKQQDKFICPTCRQTIPNEYIPQKTILWWNIIQQIQDKKGIFCHKHKQRRAVGICLEEKVFMCLDCLLEDEHPKNKKVSIEKMNNYFQQKRDFLKQICENIQNDKGIKEFEARREKAQELISKLDKLQTSKVVTEKIDILNEVETQIKIVEDLDKKVKKKNKTNSFGQKFLSLFTCQSGQQKSSSPNKEIRYIEMTLISDIDTLVQVQNKKTCTGLQIKVSQSFQDFDGFCSNLSKFVFITNLTLDLQESKSVNDVYLKKISQCLRIFGLVNTLTLNFEDCEGIGDKGTNELSSALSNITLLKSLQLNIRGCHAITQTGTNELIMALKPLTSLIKLQLYFSRCKLTEDSFKNLSVSIREMKALITLELDFNRCHVTDGMLKQLSASLGSIISLNTLALNFSKCQITDNGIKELTIGIKNLQSLVSLHLDFSNSSLLTDNSVKHVSNCVSNLALLIYLQVEFNYCYALSDVGIKELSKDLRNLKSLQSLHLGFIGYNSISDGGTEVLCQWIKSQTSLTAIQLHFDNCCLSSKGLQDLKNLVKKYQTVLTIPIVK